MDWNSVFAEHDGWLRKVVAARVGEPQAVSEVLQEDRASRQQATESAKGTDGACRVALPGGDPSDAHVSPQGAHEKRLLDRYSQERPATEPREPLDWLLADERQDLVRAALDRLGDQDREILLLKYSENWTAAQIAERLGLRLPAVEARLHRARSRLRAALGEW